MSCATSATTSVVARPRWSSSVCRETRHCMGAERETAPGPDRWHAARAHSLTQTRRTTTPSFSTSLVARARSPRRARTTTPTRRSATPSSSSTAYDPPSSVPRPPARPPHAHARACPHEAHNPALAFSTDPGVGRVGPDEARGGRRRAAAQGPAGHQGLVHPGHGPADLCLGRQKVHQGGEEQGVGCGQRTSWQSGRPSRCAP